MSYRLSSSLHSCLDFFRFDAVVCRRRVANW